MENDFVSLVLRYMSDGLYFRDAVRDAILESTGFSSIDQRNLTLISDSLIYYYPEIFLEDSIPFL